MKRSIAIALILALLASCGPREVSSAKHYRHFSVPAAPTVYSSEGDVREFLLNHYWDNFFARGGITDSSAIRGVKKDEIRQAMANYIGILESATMADAQASVAAFFRRTESAHAADTSAHLFPLFTDIVCDYLYDPNSPLRSEDLYLPFVSGLAESPYTLEDARPGYVFQKEKCSMNRYGEKVPDFRFITIDGRTLTLYGIKADYTMLFFSNPGCTSCKEIIEQVCSRPYINDFISRKVLAVANVYIDEDRKAWREYEHNYPRNWYSGYDPTLTLRDDSLYFIRAIPSLYFLDKEKRVILKDAPTEKVLAILDNTSHQYGY